LKQIEDSLKDQKKKSGDGNKLEEEDVSIAPEYLDITIYKEEIDIVMDFFTKRLTSSLKNATKV
jgi:hypothetical protein